jgi:aminoglycoside phosphotransferase (APT) family kinase protein
MMFNDAFDVVAVMDWEQPTLGGALHDLAWWIVMGEINHGKNANRPHLEGMGSREDTIALWRQVTGIPTDDLEWYEDFTQLKVCCLGTRMARMRGQAPMPDAVMARMLKLDLPA